MRRRLTDQRGSSTALKAPAVLFAFKRLPDDGPFERDL